MIYEAYKFTIKDSSKGMDQSETGTPEKNSQIQKMIGEAFEKMNEFAKKRQVSA